MFSSFLSSLLLLLLAVVYANAEIQYQDFVVKEISVKRLCKTHQVITVNGQYPGPTLTATDGDTLVIKVTNLARYNITLHWHGIQQIRNGWADGPDYITQCPIVPGATYVYKFTIINQEGTLWWHAHALWLRATVHGALIVYPKLGKPYPFDKPQREYPIILGEWWNRDPNEVLRQATITGAGPNVSDAYTINGRPGDLFPCSNQGTSIFPVVSGETTLFRIINAAMNTELFVSIAGHHMTVVAADSAYTKPFTTTVILLGPGQTTDVLVTADQPAGRYYIAARAYASAQGVPFDNTTVTAILEYKFSSCTAIHGVQTMPPPLVPLLPAYNDTSTATAFSAALHSPGPVNVPDPVNETLFFTVGLGLLGCPPGMVCGGPNGNRFAASINNASFVLPSTLSMLQAYYFNVPGVYTEDFPPEPPIMFDFTANNISLSLLQPVQGTKVYRLKYGSAVQIVFQGTNIISGEEHPMHLHGYQFYVLATGFGNFNPDVDTEKFNMVDPPERNTIGVPVNGWAVIRFIADNPGVWLLHCHIDAHLMWGLAMAFIVENGEGDDQSLLPPPLDLPVC
ncbi:laccase-3-like [Carex rostrata]